MIPLLPTPGDWISDQAGQVVENWLTDLATKTGQSAQVFLEKSATFWVTGIKSPQLTYATAQNPYTPADTVNYLWSHLHWYVAGLAIFSIFFAAGKMAWQRNGAPARELLQSILTMVVVSSAGIAAISLATTGSDQAASYILSGATTTPDGKATTFQVAMGQMFTNPKTTGQTAVLLIFLYLLILISTFIQIALLLIRGGMLFLLAGILPLAAAATNTETGRTWFRKSLAWIIAFILYKPVAAIVYATAFQLTRAGSPGRQPGALAPAPGDELMKVVTGLVMCLLAIFALPALLRFTSPAVAAVAAVGSGGGAAAAQVGAIGMGAKAVIGRFTGGGGGRSSGGGGGGRRQSGDEVGPQRPGPQGNDKPSPRTGSTGGSSGAKTGTKGAAAGGPVGATAQAVTDGIKKAQGATSKAVSHAAGEPSSGASTGPSRSKPTPNRPGAPQSGPTGGQGGKPPAGPQPTQRPNPPAPEGPTGGKRK